MSVNTITGLSAYASTQLSGVVQQQQRGQSPFQAVSSLLGMSPEDIAAQVKSGKSLDDLATSKNVSHSDLVAAIKAGLPQDVQSSGKPDTIAESIATRQGMPAHHHHHHDTDGASSSGSSGSRATGVLSGTLTASQQTMLGGLSSLLKTDPTSLMNQLQSGTSLSDPVTSAGASSASLAGVVSQSLFVDTKA